MVGRKIPSDSVASQIETLLDSREIAALIADLEALRWTGRKGYSVRSLVGACIAKSLYAIPTWSRTARLIAEHAALRDALGDTPSVYACYRFTTKLRRHSAVLAACLDRVTASLRAELPDYGSDVAIDASDLPAFANGQRFVSKGGRRVVGAPLGDLDAQGWRFSTGTRFTRPCVRAPIFDRMARPDRASARVEHGR